MVPAFRYGRPMPLLATRRQEENSTPPDTRLRILSMVLVALVLGEVKRQLDIDGAVEFVVVDERGEAAEVNEAACDGFGQSLPIHRARPGSR